MDAEFVAALMRDGRAGLSKVYAEGFSSELLDGTEREAYVFITDFVKKYDTIPTEDVLMRETGLMLAPATEPLAYVVKRLFDRRLHQTLHKGLLEAADMLEKGKPLEGRERMETLMRSVRNLDTRGAVVESIHGLGQQVVDYYDSIKAGKRGILTPWESINEATMGFWPEDLILFVARMGIGKTWTALQVAHCAWKQGKRVLIATTEMAKERMAMRYIAVKNRLPYRDLRQGRLDIFTEQRFRDEVLAAMSLPGLDIIGGDFDLSMESFAGIVADHKPDLTIVDGAYLLKVPGVNRTERAATVFDELKRIAKRNRTAVFATMQFNREVKVNQAKTVQADSIAMTDVAGWNADLIFGMIQTEEMKKNKRMAFKPLKVREGESEEIECNWDFDRMDFSELPKAAGGYGPAPTGSGVPLEGDGSDMF